jgi:hypothetical protein
MGVQKQDAGGRRLDAPGFADEIHVEEINRFHEFQRFAEFLQRLVAAIVGKLREVAEFLLLGLCCLGIFICAYGNEVTASTVRWTVRKELVPGAGIEPARRKAPDFKSTPYTNQHNYPQRKYMIHKEYVCVELCCF